MTFSKFIPDSNEDKWDRFCNLLYHDNSLNFWLDISRMDIDDDDMKLFNNQFTKAFEAIQSIEKGFEANVDEGRKVGHYWLRNPSIAPSEEIRDNISNQIRNIKQFGSNILKGAIKAPNNKKFTDVFWIGIGGSGLGPLLIIESLRNYDQGLSFHFLDNVDPNGLSNKFNMISDNLDTTLFVVVSKSGGTPEPQIGMEQAINLLKTNKLDWPSQSVAITTEGSRLYNIANEENWIGIFDLPEWVGGRTSITGAVGLLPLSLIGSDIDKFLEGASVMDELTRETNILNNPAALLALAWMKAGKGKGLRDMVVLPYRDRLEVFSRYLQQLVMESLGKKTDRKNKIVNQGLAVYGNKGSTDQHAYVQQLRDGIDNFFVTFIEILSNTEEIKEVCEKRPGDYLSGFLQGTRTALTEGGRQNLTITFAEFEERTLGALISLFERTVTIYAELININAYDQPGVEAGKKAATKILKLQHSVEELLKDGCVRTIAQIDNELDENSQENIFSIIRHLKYNYCRYIVTGDFKHPKTLTIARKDQGLNNKVD